jgi:membrane-bound ClpP family serine protease
MATSAATRTATRYPILLLLLVLGLASLALGTSLVMYVQIRRHELRSGPLRVRTFYSRSNTGVEGMLNKEGIVRADCAPEGMVEVGGELWKARSLGGTLAVGESVVVRDIEGLCLLVERLDSGAA